MRIDELVEKNYDSLNDNDLYIWQYIFHHKRDIQKTTINDLAKICNVSHTSIIRFIHKIGLEGYSELKFYLKMEVEDQAHFDNSIIYKAGDDAKRMVDKMMDDNFDDLCALIESAENIFVYGSGETQKIAAKELKRNFAFAQKISHFVSGHQEANILINQASKQDLFFMISFSGENKDMNDVARKLHEKGVSIISIAKEGETTLKEYSNFYLPFEPILFHTGYHEITYGFSLSFYIIIMFLFMRYLEYKSMNDYNE